MDDFFEQVVTRKKRGVREVLYYLSWALAVVCGVFGLLCLMNILYPDAEGAMGLNVVALIKAALLLACGFFFWRATFWLRVEYDYTFTNGILDVARVMKGKKRVYLTSVDTHELRAAGEVGSPAYGACVRESGVRVHKWFLNPGEKRYFFFYDKKGERHLTLLELNAEMVKLIFNRRYLTARVWDGAYKNV